MTIRLFLLSLVCLALSACAGARHNVPDTRYYTLEYEPPQITAQPSSAIITVSRFGVAPEFNTPKMIYRDLSFGRQEYTYHQWRSSPQVLVADYLRRDLTKTGLFQAISGPASFLAATHQVEGLVEEWMEIDGSDGWQATAELTITLLDLRALEAPDQVLFQRTYRDSQPCAKKNPGAVAEAMSRVMRTLSAQIIADIHAAVR